MKKSIFFLVIVAICALDCSISSAQNYDELITRSFDYLDADSLPEAEEALRVVTSEISKAASKGIYHKNTASRKVSRLSLAVNKIA